MLLMRLVQHIKRGFIGEISDYTCFSFQAIKHLTTGDGGAVACRDIDKYKDARVKRWFGIDRKNSEPSLLGERKFDIDELGYKYHLNDFSAGLGIMNLKGFKDRLNKRIEIANFYQKSLSSLDGISFLIIDKIDKVHIGSLVFTLKKENNLFQH